MLKILVHVHDLAFTENIFRIKKSLFISNFIPN